MRVPGSTGDMRPGSVRQPAPRAELKGAERRDTAVRGNPREQGPRHGSSADSAPTPWMHYSGVWNTTWFLGGCFALSRAWLAARHRSWTVVPCWGYMATPMLAV